MQSDGLKQERIYQLELESRTFCTTECRNDSKREYTQRTADIVKVKQQVIGHQVQSAGVGIRLYSLKMQKRKSYALVRTNEKKIGKVCGDSKHQGHGFKNKNLIWKAGFFNKWLLHPYFMLVKIVVSQTHKTKQTRSCFHIIYSGRCLPIAEETRHVENRVTLRPYRMG